MKYPGFEFKPWHVNDSSQSNQATDHLVSQRITKGLLKNVGRRPRLSSSRSPFDALRRIDKVSSGKSSKPFYHHSITQSR
jgi:hypothetical protein